MFLTIEKVVLKLRKTTSQTTIEENECCQVLCKLKMPLHCWHCWHCCRSPSSNLKRCGAQQRLGTVEPYEKHAYIVDLLSISCKKNDLNNQCIVLMI